MFKDKHVIVAMLVAPILAVIAWYGVDQIVAEKPKAAEAGGTYTLLARSNCRYESGQCDLKNADLELSLVPGLSDASSIEMQLESSIRLQGAALGLAGDDAIPSQMTRIDDQGYLWGTRIGLPANDEAMIRLAVIARDATWYAEVPTVFLKTEPGN